MAQAAVKNQAVSDILVTNQNSRNYVDLKVK